MKILSALVAVAFLTASPAFAAEEVKAAPAVPADTAAAPVAASETAPAKAEVKKEEKKAEKKAEEKKVEKK